ncbi:MAG: acylphosphatase [Pseudolabrys sp.]|nr:acylphosphatase [Pseudolabrys sp.]
MTEARIVRHVIVRGLVQGVSFRAFVEHHAKQRNLDGWVRNRKDGTVEAVFSGLEKSVEGMIEACKVGPISARVDAVDQREATVEDVSLSRAGVPFAVLPTA